MIKTIGKRGLTLEIDWRGAYYVFVSFIAIAFLIDFVINQILYAGIITVIMLLCIFNIKPGKFKIYRKKLDVDDFDIWDNIRQNPRQ